MAAYLKRENLVAKKHLANSLTIREHEIQIVLDANNINDLVCVPSVFVTGFLLWSSYREVAILCANTMLLFNCYSFVGLSFL